MVSGTVVVYFRAVSRAERDDWRVSGHLLVRPGGPTEGKCLWGSMQHAIKYSGMIRNLGWDPDAPHILRIEFPAAVSSQLEAMDSNTDGIGQAYFARQPALDLARAWEVEVER